jgi:biotin transport system substrate-specific component
MLGNKKKSLLISYTAVFVALIAAASWISLPIPPVPFTLQTLAVLLCAAVMKRYATIPVLLYLVLGCLNLPVFHNGTAGIGILFGPTGGYFIGFIFAALIAGYLYESKETMMHVVGLVFATFVILVCGVAWLALSTGMTIIAAIFAGCIPFIVGDIIKLVLAFYIAEWVGKIHPIWWDEHD